MSETRLKRPTFLHGLSFRLLVLTMFFVMLAEFLIWAPSISRFRKVYLEENLARAHLSMLAVEGMPEGLIDKSLEQTLLQHSDAYGIILNRPERRMLMLSKDMPPKVDLTIDMDIDSFLGFIGDAFETLRGEGPDFDLLVVDPPPLARRRSQVAKASRAQKDLLLHALRRARPGALVFAFSCSHHLGPDLFRKIVKAAFGQRRKTLRNAWSKLGVEDLESAAQRAGIDLAARAETLTIEQFAAMAAAVSG